MRDRLIKMGACEDAVAWVGERDIAAAWAECERADWMLWLAGRVVAREPVVLAACACARTALQYVPAGEDRPQLAIETAEAWARGEATIAEVRSADAAAARRLRRATPPPTPPTPPPPPTLPTPPPTPPAAAYATAAAYAADAAAAAAVYATSRRVALAQMAGLVRGIITAEQVAAGLEADCD